jgi:predicted nucleotide-binding protein
MDRATKDNLASIILGGDGSHDPQYPKYRSSWDLTGFFSDAGLPSLVHDGSWRRGWVRERLYELGEDDLMKVVLRLCIRREYKTEEEWNRAIELVGEVLQPEGLKVTTDATGRNVSFGVLDDDPSDAASKPNTAEAAILATATPLNKIDIMVVHGRNTAVRDEMFAFLFAIGLQPIEWNDAVARAGGGSPYNGQIVRRALEEAGAVIVLLTGDDIARLQNQFITPSDGPDERELTTQARPNVILELGMALMAGESNTIIVELEPTRIITDLVGRNTIRFSGDVRWRQALIDRLDAAGCPVKRTGDYWMVAGDFSKAMADPAPNTIVSAQTPSNLTMNEVQKALDLTINRLEEKSRILGRLRLARLKEVDSDDRVYLSVSVRDYSLIEHFLLLEAELRSLLKRPIKLRARKEIF